jgi:hypothetical protein
MKTIGRLCLFIILILALACPCFASPFLVCDPQAGVTSYKLTGPAWIPSSVPAQPDGSIKMDVSGALVGSTSLTIAACKTDPIWGEQCSSTTPFTFTRPEAPTTPNGVKLAP